MRYDRDIMISTAPSARSDTWRAQQLTWSAMVARLQQDPPRGDETMGQYHEMSKEGRDGLKDVGGFVGGTFKGQRRRKADAVGRDLVTLDYDRLAPDGIDILKGKLREMGCAWALYSTRSHTAESPRVRILIPLDQTVAAAEYQPIVRRVAEKLSIDWCDPSSFKVEQLMYWPSVCNDAELVFDYVDAPLLGAAGVLQTYKNWRDQTEWPRGENEHGIRRESAKKVENPRQKPGWVGAFCRVYDIPAAIGTFIPGIYRQEEQGCYTFTGGTSVKGMKLLDGTDICYSHHESDPVTGHAVNAFDLVRVHKYGSLDDGIDKNLPVQQLPSYAAMRDLCMLDEAVVTEFEAHREAELRAAVRQKEAENFYDSSMNYGTLEIPADETDTAFARAFGRWAKGKVCFNRSLGWMYFDGSRWRADQEDLCTRLLISYIDALHELAKANQRQAPDDAENIALAKSTRRAKAAGRINGIASIAERLLAIPDVDAFDAYPHLLNTPGGAVDLRTGELLPCDPDLLLTQCAAFKPDPSGDHPLWDDLLTKICQGDQGMIDYLQTSFGMALFGAVYEEGMLLAVGPKGSNGKSTLFGTILGVLGDYGQTIRPELIMESRSEVVGLADIRGKRLVVMAETDEGARLSSSMLKRLTSRDKISAKPLYLNPFSFMPTHTLVMHTNFLPKLKSLDGGTRRRIAVVPMAHRFEGAGVITDFGERLIKQEGPAILGWMIKGAVRFWAAGKRLHKPQVVARATEEYFEDEDWVTRFLTERCLIDEGERVGAQLLYDTYLNWERENGSRTWKNSKDFKAALEARGYKQGQTSGRMIWRGIGLPL